MRRSPKLSLTIVAVVFIATFILSACDSRPRHPQMVKSIISRNGPIARALDMFKRDVGTYPDELIQLVEQPEDEEAKAKWNGPYLRNFDDVRDAWGQRLEYRYPGKNHKDGYDLWSIGPDGEDGTDDDITN